MPSTFQRRLAIVAASSAAVSFAGGAYAASHDPSTVGRQELLKAVAKRMKITPEQLESELTTEPGFTDAPDPGLLAAAR